MECRYYGNCIYGRAAACPSPFRYILVSRVAALPLSLAEAKKQLNIDSDFTDDDDYITALIGAAADAFEGYTNTTLMESTYTTNRTCWTCPMELKRRPLISVTSIKYNDEDDVDQTVDSADYKAISEYPFGRIYFKDTFDYPTLANYPSQITITFKAGLYSATADVVPSLKQGLLEHVAYLYANRGDCSNENANDSLSVASKRFYNPYRIYEL